MKLSPFWSGTAAALLILLLVTVIERHHQSHNTALRQLEVAQELRLVQTRIEAQLSHYRYLAAALAARAAVSPHEFAAMLRRLLGEDALLRGVHLVHGEMTHPVLTADAATLQLRLPVRVAATAETPGYAGWVELELDKPTLLARAGLLPGDGELQLALRTEAGEVLAGAPELFGTAQAELEIDLPGGRWTLAGSRRPAAHGMPWVLLLGSGYALLGGIVIGWLRAGQLSARRQALHDFLTGLPNRRLLQDRLEQACAAATRSGQHVVLLYLDLDNFKPVNDNHGHQAGDVVLRAVARRLRQAVRRSDTVARVSGDEFVLLLQDLASPREAEKVAEKVLRSFDLPIPAGQHAFTLGCSIGLARVDGALDEALGRADLAMYQAKRNGKNSYRWYSPVPQPGPAVTGPAPVPRLPV